MELILSHHEKIAAARGIAVKTMPYFAAALYGLMPTPCEGMYDRSGVGMAVTARAVMYYDPRVIAELWSINDVVFGLLHEVGHILRSHAKRCDDNDYDRRLWNVAGDAAINDDLVAAGCVPLPSDVLPSHIIDPATSAPMEDFMPEEAYYRALLDMRHQRNPPPLPGGRGQAGDDSEPSPAPAPGKQPSAGQDDAQKQMSPPRPGGGNCGGCAGNPIDGIDGSDALADAEDGRSDVEIERIKSAVANDIKSAEMSGRGHVPAGWRVWADQQLTAPKIRWQDKLRRAVRVSTTRVRGLVDYHYERPARRQWALGHSAGTPILPSMFAPSPRIGVFVDTSGSMGAEDLQIAMSEVDGVLKTLSGTNVIFGACDAQVHGEVARVNSIVEACARLRGGGGTNFTPVFDHVTSMSRSQRPHVLIFLTDGDGPAPTNPPPGLTVIWVLCGSHARVPYTADRRPVKWGEQIFVTLDSVRAA